MGPFVPPFVRFVVNLHARKRCFCGGGGRGDEIVNEKTTTRHNLRLTFSWSCAVLVLLATRHTFSVKKYHYCRRRSFETHFKVASEASNADTTSVEVIGNTPKTKKVPMLKWGRFPPRYLTRIDLSQKDFASKQKSLTNLIYPISTCNQPCQFG